MPVALATPATNLLALRLANHHLTTPHLSDPSQLVTHLGAVQSQDYGAAKWALGQRLLNATDASLDRAFDDGAILRTHVLRPTWHFVTPADIRWLLRLTAPRIKASAAGYERRLGIDEALVRRSNAAIARALRGAKHLTRGELDAALRRAGIAAKDGPTLGHIMMRAELDGLICSGPRHGKQFTYALLEERVPPPPAAAPHDRDSALAALTTRYFTSHGPATRQDCAWWSGLALADVNRGLSLVGHRLAQESMDGLTYWFAPPTSRAPSTHATVHLLPNYDEYTVAYHHRDLYFDPSLKTGNPRDDVPFGNAIVVDGQVAGTWSRTIAQDTVALHPRWHHPPTKSHQRALASAAHRYAAFLALRLDLAA